jgi:hypothetical protein
MEPKFQDLIQLSDLIQKAKQKRRVDCKAEATPYLTEIPDFAMYFYLTPESTGPEHTPEGFFKVGRLGRTQHVLYPHLSDLQGREHEPPEWKYDGNDGGSTPINVLRRHHDEALDTERNQPAGVATIQ